MPTTAGGRGPQSLGPASSGAELGLDPGSNFLSASLSAPVLFFFSGTHADYHKPSDTADKLNGAGMGAISVLGADLVSKLAKLEQRLTFQKVASLAPLGDPRSFGASLGTIPDYAASASTKGVVLSGVRPGGAADLAGAKRGDVLVKVGRFEVGSVEDLMFALGELRPKAKIKLVVLREGKRVELDAVVQEAKQKH